jgi:hypothetical protein
VPFFAPLFARFPGQPKLAASELAQQLFTVFVIADEVTIMAPEYGRFASEAGFAPDVFELRRLIYLIASAALALGSIEYMKNVVPHFRALALDEMLKRRGHNETTIDSEIESAVSNCAKLMFADPSKDTGLSFDWAREWLHQVGIEETNPATLFAISTTWKNHFLDTSKFLSNVRMR